MNKTVIKTNYETRVSHTYAIPRTAVGYGRAIPIEPKNVREQLRRQSLKSHFSFYYGEYITGILFISALLLYTLLTPIKASSPIKYVMAMFDKGLKKMLDIGGAALGLLLAVMAMFDKGLKKMLDIGGAALGLLLALPIFIIIPILIKLTSRGPVFYTQERIGINRRRRIRRIYKTDINGENRIRERRRIDNYGRPFKVIKFRTMMQDAEKKSGAVWATQNDPRVTTLGRFLRKTRIDEIPQLINVIKGDMSMVGPRPERPIFVRDLKDRVPNYEVRLRVKPGITGLAQVSQGYDSSIESVADKVSHDVKYIRSWSIFTDLKILARTVVVVLTGRGAC